MERSRGQILLVAAFSLAVIFVSLAVILNTAIFTENLATRDTIDGDDALDFQQTSAQTGAVLLNATNYEDGSYSTLEAAYSTRIENFSEAITVHGVSRGTVLSVSVSETTEGAAINLTDSAAFQNASANGTWELGDGITDARKGKLVVTDTPRDEPLVLNATNGSHTWSLSITDESDGSYGATLTYPNGTEASRQYTTTALQVRPTNGTINGSESWEGLRFQDAIDGQFSMWVRNGTNASGSYRLLVDQPVGTIDGPNYTGSDDLTVSGAIYTATLSLELSRADLDYATTIHLEPEGKTHRG